MPDVNQDKTGEAHLRTSFMQPYARSWMTALLLLTDFSSLFLAGLSAVGLRMALSELMNPPFYWSLVPLIAIFLGVFALRGLYPAVGLSPVEELRRLTTSTSVVFLIITAFTFWARTAELYSRLVFAFSWTFSLVYVPFSRWLLRVVAVRLGIWGEPVAVIGSGEQAQKIVKFLLNRMRFGLRPAVIIDCSQNTPPTALPIPRLVYDIGEDLEEVLKSAGIETAILIASELPETLQNAIVNEEVFRFQRLILISDLNWIGSLGITPYDLEGFLGLEVRQNLLNVWQQRTKRLMDLFMSLIISLIIFPFLALIALLIRLDSPGKVFFGHERIGKGGKKITIWKFRTMIQGADQALEDHLAKHPRAKAEWETTQKLRDDPRVTRIGQFLRKYSLDELPQLWNVFKGEMSLVGPRPIVQQEIFHYRQGYALYNRVLPGITGLWQVSGRTDTSYEERVRFDEYYVRNWSLWLDIYILLRTPWAVIQRKGAY